MLICGGGRGEERGGGLTTGREDGARDGGVGMGFLLPFAMESVESVGKKRDFPSRVAGPGRMSVGFGSGQPVTSSFEAGVTGIIFSVWLSRSLEEKVGGEVGTPVLIPSGAFADPGTGNAALLGAPFPL